MYFTFTESAVKDVRRLPIQTQRALQTKLRYWQGHADPLHFAKPLMKHRAATHRFRFGVYRILVMTTGDELRILRVRHRREVYQ